MKFEEDIRWKQRFQNFSRAFTLLNEALDGKDIEKYSGLEKEGIIQRFEYTFELGWKTFKDYLNYSGVEIDEITPRKVIKECATRGIFAGANIDPKIYMDMMLERTALFHTYDLEGVNQVVLRIKNIYLKELKAQYHFLKKEE